MKIDRVVIEDLLAFMFSNIKKMDLTTESLVQVIIGANGSGKTSLLAEINPLPAVRSNYGPEGKKTIYITHKGSEYVLTSDFKNSSGAHSFVKDGVELNDSGTTGVQEDLVKEHLGYTKMTDMILTNKHKFVKLAPAARRQLIMTISPFQLGHLLDKHKAVMSKLKACKNNLTMLYERKALLESEMLDPSVVEHMLAEKQGLTKEYDLAVEFGHRISEALRGIRIEEHGDIASSLTRFQENALKIRRHAPLWRDVPRENADEHLLKVTEDIAAKSATLVSLYEQIKSTLEEVARLEHHLNEIKANANAHGLDDEIKALTEEVKVLEKHVSLSPYPRASMDGLEPVLDRLQELVHAFVGCDVTLIPYATIVRKENHVKRWYWIADRLRAERNKIQDRLAELRGLMKDEIGSVPIDKCAQYQCPLYLNWASSSKKLRDEQEHLNAAIDRLDRRLKRIARYLEVQGEKLQRLHQYVPKIQDIVSLLNEHPYLKSALGSKTLLDTLQNNPLVIYKRAFNEYRASVRAYQLSDAKELLLKRLDEKARLAKTDASEQDLVDRLLKEKTGVYQDLMRKRVLLEGSLNDLGGYKKRISDYLGSLKYLSNSKDELNRLSDTAMKKYEHDILKGVLGVLTSFKKEAMERLVGIDRILKEQDLLKARYDNEVIGQIESIEKEKEEYEQLEAALSPNSGIPHQYTVRYLNAVIQSMNLYISYVFSYPFGIVPLDPNAPVDFKFKAFAKDVLVPEISECSEAQEEILNVAFTFATVKHLKLTDYPAHLDEVGRTFDPHHKQQLLTLIRLLLDESTISQLFLINHHAVVSGGLANADVLVVNDMNVMVPSVYNQHVSMEYR